MDLDWWKLRPSILAAWFGRRRPHFHSDEGAFSTWVLIGAEEGNFNFELAGLSGTAGFGDLLICPPNVVVRRHIKRHMTHHVLMFDFVDDRGEAIEKAAALPYGKVTVRNLARLSSNYSYLQNLEGKHDALSMHLKEHILNDMLLLDRLHAPTAIRTPEPRTEDGLMARAEHYLREHLHEPIRLKLVAESLGLNPVQFARRFRAALGCTPIEYLTSLRLDRAKALLIETDFTIDDIAHRCGYNNGLYLSRVFMKELKIRPGRFRALQRM